MKKCFRIKCQKDFEPNKPKQVFCSAKCRVYFSRELKKQIEENNMPENKLKNSAGRDTPHKAANYFKKPLYLKDAESAKSKNQMPDGLDRLAKMRWLRENS